MLIGVGRNRFDRRKGQRSERAVKVQPLSGNRIIRKRRNRISGIDHGFDDVGNRRTRGIRPSYGGGSGNVRSGHGSPLHVRVTVVGTVAQIAAEHFDFVDETSVVISVGRVRNPAETVSEIRSEVRSRDRYRFEMEKRGAGRIGIAIDRHFVPTERFGEVRSVRRILERNVIAVVLGIVLRIAGRPEIYAGGIGSGETERRRRGGVVGIVGVRSAQVRKEDLVERPVGDVVGSPIARFFKTGRQSGSLDGLKILIRSRYRFRRRYRAVYVRTGRAHVHGFQPVVGKRRHRIGLGGRGDRDDVRESRTGRRRNPVSGGI